MVPGQQFLMAARGHHCIQCTDVEAEPQVKSQVQVHVAGKG